jgi:TusA-related sulfurtransferase
MMGITEQLDVRKTVCPLTVITVLRKIKTMNPGDSMEVLIAGEEGVKSITKEMSKKGHQFETETFPNGEYKLLITLR